ncbi:hypothetical protein PN466_21020 [Roseofilum reptotaenium CS-1145]|uniref:Uncharacterized protein n=1 Tax=Roseofilum reptotaenium AO1-A TaxID=1925591 RepID=A0A1L9QLQ3_9CYAN|nr:hypothetical protein [Roseofilum reptotaenium]MDB9519429.1 hypothetical protein [Roseofilum reptotaenium CS-1145]OJJ19800.1 hypothetical protein BI308_21055 [Roseofilum reptotaenium AO1-A]
MAELVEKGDWIKFNPPQEPENVNIKWQQDLGNREQPYIPLLYSVNGKKASGSLFVSASEADAFFEKCEPNESKNPLVKGGYKIQVDDGFQYGQNNEKTLRFLVYHDKSNKPYQHRFIETTAFSNIGRKISAISAAAGETTSEAKAWGMLVEQGMEIGKAFIGDYLRDF